MTQEKLNGLIQGIPEMNKIEIDAISSSEDFFYQKAKDAWEEWKATAVSDDLLAKLINMSYEEIRGSSESDVVEIRNKMFSFVAYCDLNAKDKQALNEYPDKRTVAHSGIRQSNWVNLLLRFKNGEVKLTAAFWNLIIYLENPDNNFPILSEKHKELIFNYFVAKQYNADIFADEMKRIFSPYSQCKNSSNETAWITNVIYSLTGKWNPKKIKGLFAHDNTGWQDKTIAESKGGALCLWWHQLPSSKYKDEIMGVLRTLVENGENFDFYYIQNNYAGYRATIIDLATKDEYESKFLDWKDYKPYGLETDFEEYQDGVRRAEVVFLASKFEKLSSEIYVDNFVRFKNMPDNIRGGIAAYTRIQTDNEIKTKKMIDQHIELLKSNKNLILTGAPGTGKTYLAKQMAKQMIGTDDLENNEQYGFVQFHPSYDYTDFVEGLRPTKSDDNGNIGFELKEGVFKKFCGKALADGDKKYVFVIDEINRGDISKIFGELFFSIDPGYRGAEKGRVNTQYQNLIEENDAFYGGFYVPENVYIIGTMNDIDRSVESFDFAMRRRFVWQEVTAEESAENMGLSGGTKDRMKRLNDEIANTEGLNSSYQIGGAYFLDSEGKERNDYDDIWELRLKPLLSEYLRGMPDAKNTLEKLKNAYDGISGTTPNNGQ